MKKVVTFVLIIAIMAATCLPALAAEKSTQVCPYCERYDQVDFLREEWGLDRVVECPMHGTHDAEEYHVHEVYCCYNCRIEFWIFLGEEYICLD